MNTTRVAGATVTGALTVNGAAGIAGSLAASGATLGGGAAAPGSTLTVNGPATISASATIGGSLAVTGSAVASSLFIKPGSFSAKLAYDGPSNRVYTLPNAPASAGDRPLYIDTLGNITVGHGTKPLHYSAMGASLGSGASSAILPAVGTSFDRSGGLQLAIASTTERAFKPIDGLLEGAVMTAVTFHVGRVGAGNTTFNVYRKKSGPAGSAPAVIGTVNSSTTGSQSITAGLNAPETISSDTVYFVEWAPSGGANSGELWHGFTVFVNQPT